MKPLAVTFLFVVVLAFVSPVSAQTLTPGQFAATAFVAKAQEQADKVRRRIDAPTLTPQPTRTPTEIPTATYTPMPTATSLPTATNTQQPTREPSATANLGATVVGVIVQAVNIAQPTPKPVASEGKNDKTAIYIFAGFAAIVIVAAVAVLLFKPETYTFYK